MASLDCAEKTTWTGLASLLVDVSADATAWLDE